jgi:hypothetical protein
MLKQGCIYFFVVYITTLSFAKILKVIKHHAMKAYGGVDA